MRMGVASPDECSTPNSLNPKPCKKARNFDSCHARGKKPYKSATSRTWPRSRSAAPWWQLTETARNASKGVEEAAALWLVLQQVESRAVTLQATVGVLQPCRPATGPERAGGGFCRLPPRAHLDLARRPHQAILGIGQLPRVGPCDRPPGGGGEGSVH